MYLPVIGSQRFKDSITVEESPVVNGKVGFMSREDPAINQTRSFMDRFRTNNLSCRPRGICVLRNRCKFLLTLVVLGSACAVVKPIRRLSTQQGIGNFFGTEVVETVRSTGLAVLKNLTTGNGSVEPFK